MAGTRGRPDARARTEEHARREHHVWALFVIGSALIALALLSVPAAIAGTALLCGAQLMLLPVTRWIRGRRRAVKVDWDAFMQELDRWEHRRDSQSHPPRS